MADSCRRIRGQVISRMGTPGETVVTNLEIDGLLGQVIVLFYLEQ